MFDIAAAFQAFCTAVSKLFELKTVQVQKQETTEIIHEKKDFKKATNIAEEIISLTQKYYSKMTLCDKLKFSRLLNRFYKVN